MIWFILGAVVAVAVLILALLGQVTIALVGGVVMLSLVVGWMAYRLSQVWSYCTRLKEYTGKNVPEVQAKFVAIVAAIQRNHPNEFQNDPGGVPSTPDPNFP